MKLRAIHLYVVLVCLAGIAAQPLLDWAAFLALGPKHWWGLAALTLLGVVSESLAVTIKFGGSAGNTSITFIPLSASVLAFGAPSAVVFVFLTGLVAEFVIRKKEPIRATFNIGQYLLATALAGWVFASAHGEPQAVAFAATEEFDFQAWPFIAFG
ncbi:MAG TPA: hypothetical protein VLA36_04000, partial [Longimicrobiales bacterium]|nr:hypothetical protein [Longimicrobiales bacterium]